MGLFELVGLAIFAIVAGILVMAESESIKLSDNQKRAIAVSAIVLVVGGGITLFLVEDSLGDFTFTQPENKKGKKDAKGRVNVIDAGNSEDDSGGGGGVAARGGDDNGPGEQEMSEGGGGGGQNRMAKPRSKVPTFRDCPDCPLMVTIPSGSFIMGSEDTEPGRDRWEGPTREIKIPAPYAISKFEIQRGEFRKFVEQAKYKPTSSCMVDGEPRQGANFLNAGIKQEDHHPVVCISYGDAKAYVSWVSKMAKAKYRLLSEAEWEFAARAGRATPYSTGTDIGPDAAHFNGAGKSTVAVGSFEENAYGASDMHGNAAEFVDDCWHASFVHAPTDGSPWHKMGNCGLRVIKGGSWRDPESLLRAAARSPYGVSDASNLVGLRVAKELR